MDIKNKVLEALQMQPLSEDEKKSRHILGRLYGPIATCVESTRNGRKYNRELWEKQLNDEIFQEKVANKSLFLELGHPADREETDMEKVCACIPELPKIVDDDLYAYVDILDTHNGRLLKTLCDYGFVPGISSRGSGDIMDNDEVDPETFFLETWDIVQLPAVKKARMQVCEAIDPNKMKLRKALEESFKNSSDEDKKIMKETLDNLGIDFEESDANVEKSSCLKEALSGDEFDKVVELSKKCGLDKISDLGDFMKEHNIDNSGKGLVDALQEYCDKITTEEIKESVKADELNPEEIKQKLQNEIKDYFKDDPEFLDFTSLNIEDSDESLIIRLGAELDYSDMEALIAPLDKIIQAYDKDAYFEMDDPGIASCYIWKRGKNEAMNEDVKIILHKSFDDVPLDPEEFKDSELNSIEDENVLTEATEDSEATEEEVEETEENIAEESEEVLAEEPVEETPAEVEAEEPVEEESTEETEEETPDEESSEEESVEENSALNTVKGLKEIISEFDDELPIEFGDIIIDDKKYAADLSIEKDESEDKVIIGVNCIPVEEEDNENIEDVEADEVDETAEIESEDESEEAVDDGDEEVIESLKEAVRQKDALEKEVKILRNNQTVGDAKVKKLREMVERYKTAFERTSELASKTTKLEAEKKELQEKLTQKDTKIKELQSQASEATKLTESIHSSKDQIKSLNEKFDAFQKEAAEKEKVLAEAIDGYKQKLSERTILAKKYKAKASEVLDRYIESKASMLGVRSSDIMNRLSESYTIDDIEKACDDILTEDVNINSLPFGFNNSTTISVKESAERKPMNVKVDPENGYELDDSLFELAGLKRNQF